MVAVNAKSVWPSISGPVVSIMLLMMKVAAQKGAKLEAPVCHWGSVQIVVQVILWMAVSNYVAQVTSDCV